MLHLHRFAYFLSFANSRWWWAFCLQDSRTPWSESDDGTQSRCRFWTYVSPLLPGLTYTHATTAAATLMRSRNPAAEFSDMAGKALTIEWLVENAPTIFPPLPTLSHWSLFSQIFTRLLNLRSSYNIIPMFSYLTAFVSIMCYYHTFLFIPPYTPFFFWFNLNFFFFLFFRKMPWLSFRMRIFQRLAWYQTFTFHLFLTISPFTFNAGDLVAVYLG